MTRLVTGVCKTRKNRVALGERLKVSAYAVAYGLFLLPFLWVCDPGLHKNELAMVRCYINISGGVWLLLFFDCPEVLTVSGCQQSFNSQEWLNK